MATLRRYFDLLFTKQLGALLELIDDDIEWLIVPTGDVIRGKAQFTQLAQNHWAASPDRVKKLINLFACDDQACLEYTTSGTLTGAVDFGSQQLAASGRKYELQCCFVFHFKNSRIDRVREYFDLATVEALTQSTVH